MNPQYLQTLRLLTQVAPIIFQGGQFALKGGTAINLFWREMPRLSVDLDLVFVDHAQPREQALATINQAVRAMAARLDRRGFQTHTVSSQGVGEIKLLVRRDRIEIKVEINPVMRGTLQPVVNRSLSAAASEALMADLALPLVSFEDAYGGKLVAAMDRQHPRDIFDVKGLVDAEGITPAVRQSFVAYLASHNRPIHEVLAPVERDIRQDYERTFRGMTAEPVELEALFDVRRELFETLPHSLGSNERQFLFSLAQARPNWELLDIPHLADLPAIRWKLKNLQRLQSENRSKFEDQALQVSRLLDA